MKKKRMKSFIVLSSPILDAFLFYKREHELSTVDALERLLAVGLSDTSPIEISMLDYGVSSPYYVEPRTFNGKILIQSYCRCWHKKKKGK
jgi:hypothetical protein